MSVIEYIETVPREHLCLFYQSKEDMLEVLVPYFQIGINNNNLCVWITSESVSAKEAKDAMKKSIPGFDQYLKTGQIEIIPDTEWYVKDGIFDGKRVIEQWSNKYNEALHRGYKGLWVSGDTAPFRDKYWQCLMDYEREMDDVLNKCNATAICTYHLSLNGKKDLLNIISTHQRCLIKQAGKWILTTLSLFSLSDRALRDISISMIVYQDIRETLNMLFVSLKEILPVVSIELYARTSGKDIFYFDNEICHNVSHEMPSYVRSTLNLNKKSWLAKNKDCWKKVMIPYQFTSAMKNRRTPAILMPIFSQNTGSMPALAVLRLERNINIPRDAGKILEMLNIIMETSIERECLSNTSHIDSIKNHALATRDHLTGLYNRLYMEEMLKQFIQIHNRTGKYSLVSIMLDIDNFKQINDTHGHSTGDKVLKEVASAIIRNIRASDLAVRYGGDEFILFLMGQTLQNGIALAEKIRSIISLLSFDILTHVHKFTISAGVASHLQKESLDDFIHRADMALYKAKSMGRNAVWFDEAAS
jgi:diguanylate cyclase (GGDEF)-like protein